MKDSLYYVGIKDPAEMRRTLLYSSKDLIDSLRGYENFKKIKERKKNLIEELKLTIEELIVLNRRLTVRLPKGYIKPERTSKPRMVEKPHSQLEILERELSKVENRLKELE